MGRKVEAKIEYESVKIKKSIVEMVRGNKAKSGVPISVFFEMIAIKELKKKK